MKQKLLTLGSLAAAIFIVAQPAANAQSAADCEAYARNYARGQHSIIGGAARGAIRSSLFGAIIDGGKGATRGAEMGAIVSGVRQGARQRRAFEDAYRYCMARR